MEYRAVSRDAGRPFALGALWQLWSGLLISMEDLGSFPINDSLLVLFLFFLVRLTRSCRPLLTPFPFFLNKRKKNRISNVFDLLLLD